MKQYLEIANSYRQRAEELYTIAGGTREPSSKKILLRIALDYEQMAESWEQLVLMTKGRDKDDKR